MGDQQGTTVTIRPLTVEEKKKYRGEFLVCTAVTEETPFSDVHVVFQRLGKNLMPEDFKKLKAMQEHDVIDAEGRIPPNHTASMGFFPKAVSRIRLASAP